MSSVNKLDIKIIELIVRAQMWSDAAKGIYSDLRDSRYNAINNSKYFCYYKKDQCICNALSLINSVDVKHTNIRYYIGKDETLSGSALVYFEVRHEGLKYQISFHSFTDGIVNRIGAGMPMRWKGKVGSSRACALALQTLLW